MTPTNHWDGNFLLVGHEPDEWGDRSLSENAIGSALIVSSRDQFPSVLCPQDAVRLVGCNLRASIQRRASVRAVT